MHTMQDFDFALCMDCSWSSANQF